MKKLLIGIIIGVALTASTSVFADSIEQYILTKVKYPVIVKGKEYINAELPVLNYQGNTYVPLKAVGDVLGASVVWNQGLERVEISIGDSSASKGGSSASASDKKSNAGTQTANQPEILNGYLQNAESPAIKYQGIIYLPIRSGAEKYNLIPVWNDSSQTLGFEKSNIQTKISNEMVNGVDGFIYNGIPYVKEILFVQASTNAKADVDQFKQSIDQSYESFKMVIPVDRKELTKDNVVWTEVVHKGELDVDTFFKWWNGLGEKRKQYTEDYAKELQKLNPDYPIHLRVFYSGTVKHLISETIVNKDGTVSLSLVYEISNPNPDQSSIK